LVLTINTYVMAPIGDVLHRGIIAEPRADRSLGEGMVCVEFTPLVKVMKPYKDIEYITCPASNVTVGWF
jgi:hypothetical protein